MKIYKSILFTAELVEGNDSSVSITRRDASKDSKYEHIIYEHKGFQRDPRALRRKKMCHEIGHAVFCLHGNYLAQKPLHDLVGSFMERGTQFIENGLDYSGPD